MKEKLSTDNQQLQSENTKAVENCKAMQLRYEDQLRQIQAATRELDMCRSRVRAIGQEKDAKDRDGSDVKKERDELQSQIPKLQKVLNDLKKEYDESKQKTIKTKEDINNKYNLLLKKYNKLKSDAQILKEYYKKLKLSQNKIHSYNDSIESDLL